VLIVFIFGIFIKVDGATVTLVLSGLGVDLSGIDLGLRMAGGLFAVVNATDRTLSNTPNRFDDRVAGRSCGVATGDDG